MSYMATPPNDDTKALFKLLVDREWHNYREIRDELARKVAPGRAVRKYEQDLMHSRKQHHNDPDPPVRKTEAEMIEIGGRSCAQVAITSWKRAGAILQRGENNGREIKVRAGFTSFGIPGFEPTPQDEDPASKPEGYTDPPPADSKPSEGEQEAVADVFPVVEAPHSLPVAALAEHSPEEIGYLRAQALRRLVEPEEVARQFVRVEGEWKPAERFEETRPLAHAVSQEGGVLPASSEQPSCEICGLTVGNEARHSQWHEEQKQEDTPSDVALLNESQLRTLIRAEVGALFDHFQDGVQGYLDAQFAQLEEHILATRRPAPRWMRTDG